MFASGKGQLSALGSQTEARLEMLRPLSETLAKIKILFGNYVNYN